MTKCLCALLACLLLYAPITVRAQAKSANDIPTTETASPDARNPLNVQRQGALRIYPLSTRNTYEIFATEDGILLFSGSDSTTLTLLTGEELSVTAELSLDFKLSPEDPSLQLHDGAVSFYHPRNREVLILDNRLKEVRRIPAPDTLTGTPILSADRRTLYYCTSRSVMAWNLETGIHRTVKEMAYESQSVTGVHCGDSVLACRILDNGAAYTCYLAADTGQLLQQHEGTIPLVTDSTHYYASIPAGEISLPLFGIPGEAPQMLIPGDLTAKICFLPEQHAAVAVSALPEENIRLEYYDLETGMQASALSLDTCQLPGHVVSSGGCIYFLIYDPAADCDILYRWNPASPDLAVTDGRIYTANYQTRQAPDRIGLARCRDYAGEISRRYGINVLIWEEAAALQPPDFRLEPEYLAPVLYRELQLLDQRLGRYPEGFLSATASCFSGIRICIVRSIHGTADSGTAEVPSAGIRFLNGTEACVVIAAGARAEEALYRNLFHVMQTRILNRSIAFDQWDKLNPADFSYHYGRTQPEYDLYLQPDRRAFVDSASMASPGDDRAAILAAAMLPGNEVLFQSPVLQQKLTQICIGIREAYGLKKYPNALPWELYLVQPLH